MDLKSKEQMKVKLVSKTKIEQSYLNDLIKEALEDDIEFIKNIQDAEGLMSYIARVSSSNQKNAEYAKLLRYCADHGHWSVFEMADVTFEVETSRAIAQQIIRHKSLNFQEFSQRYAKADLGFEVYEARRQDKKNRQNSINDLSEDTKTWFLEAQNQINTLAQQLYNEALKREIAKESARFLLPLSTKTKIYMKGSLRSWIHYIQVRADAATQKEHREIAEDIKRQLSKSFPIVAKAMDWS